MGAYVSGGIGSAVYIAILSAIYKKNLKPGLAVLGNISIGGAIERALHFPDKVTLLSENGAKTVLVPMDNLSEISTIPTSILGKTDVPFYGNSQMLLQKGVLGE
jgi:ATP-dependent Lon protease